MRRFRTAHRFLNRLTQPSSAAGLAALLALMIPELAAYAPVIVDVGLTLIAIVAALVAMLTCECRGCSDDDRS